jgi:hypothetical protein
MSKLPWLLLIVIVLALLENYNYIGLDAFLAISVFYLFIIGLSLEMEEIKNKESLKMFLNSKIENMEKMIIATAFRLDSDSRIKDRISRGKREIIEWLNKL